ncbi:MAG: helix-turn-helix domain-containing protein [Gemmatales bacterium]|nr:helix-turn-helix domain-containing protein [Gemmatales bacterium]
MFKVDRRGTDPERRTQAHILLALGDGVACAVIAEVLFTSTATINRWRRRYLDEWLRWILGRRC